MPRSASQYARPAQQASELTTLPAPVKGLNARDALASMPSDNAIVMENLWPSTAGVTVRPGWFRHYSGIPGDATVETLIKYNGPAGGERLFAAVGGNFINVTLPGTYDAGDIVETGLSNDRWQYVQMANMTGDYTVAVNGEDEPRYYDNTAWNVATITADAGLYPDFDPTKLINIAQMHRRLWFVEKDSTRAWYLPTDVVQGEVKLFDLGEIFPLGGYLQACISWSVDTGAGMDDQSVFISSKGNIAVFSGFDPDDVLTFTIAGVYSIGSTFSRRCACPYGSDVLVLCEDGVLTLTSILSQSKVLMAPPLTDIIQNRLSDAVSNFSTEYAWDLFTSARHSLLFVNIPDPEACYQEGMNTSLNAWATLKGHNAFCWENHYEEPYFGSIGYVGRAWNALGVDDPVTVDTVTTGNAISSRCLQAFNVFGSAVQKSWSLARPVFISARKPLLDVFFNTDYEVVENLAHMPDAMGIPGGVALWDTGLWDTAVWSGGNRTWKDWYGLNNLGFSGAIFLRMSTTEPTLWLSTDFQLHKGGTL